MAYGLGVDLGTTYSAAAVGQDGRVEPFGLGTTAPAIPSVVVVREDGEVLVGEAAERRAASEPTRTAREFKRRLGDSTPIVVGGTPYGAEALMAHLARAIVSQVTEREGDQPGHVVLTHPANYAQFKTDLLRECARLAGLDMGRVSLLAEPEAAAINYASQQRVETGQVVAVYDFGGGTFDAAVVRKTPAGFEIIGTPEGIERLGGIDIDAAILAHVDSAVDGQLHELDTSDPAVHSALSRLRDECRRAKEALSTDTDTAIPVAVPGLQTEVRLTRTELEAMIRPRIRETVDALERAVGSAGLSMADVGRILLVGGTSRIPLIGEMLREATGRPVALDAHPKFAIASGAAAEAGRIASERDAEALAATAVIAPVATAAAGASAQANRVPAAATAASTTSGAAPASEQERGGPPILAIVGVLVVLVAVVGGAFLLLGRGSGGDVASSQAAGESSSEPGGSVAQVASPSSAAATPAASAVQSTVASAPDPATPAASGPSSTSSTPGGVGPGSAVVSAFAGLGTSNNPTVGEGGPATAAALNLAEDVAAAPNGDVWIADRNSRRLLLVRDGILTAAYRGTENAEDNDVSGVAVAPDGSVAFTTGTGIRAMAAGGSDSKILSNDPAVADTNGFGTKLAYAPDGTLYYGTGRYNQQVFTVGAGGKLTPFAGTGRPDGNSATASGPAVSTPIGTISDLAVDSQGRVYISDEDLGVVRRVEADGTISAIVGGGATNPVAGDGVKATDLKLPPGDVGIALDDEDRLYVTSSSLGLLIRVATDGTVSMISANGTATVPGKAARDTQFHHPSRQVITPTGDLLTLVEGGGLLWQVAGVAGL